MKIVQIALCCSFVLGSWSVCSSAYADDVSARLGKHFEAAELDDAAAWLKEELVADPGKGQVQLASAITRVLIAIETFGQQQYRYGALSGSVRTLPVLRIPVPTNKTPEGVQYEDVRELLKTFQSEIAAAEKELAAVDTSQEIKLLIDVANVNLDFDGDGTLGKSENFLSVLGAVNRLGGSRPETMPVAFDAGDVPWLRGYCHFLMGFCDMVLAYDQQRLFDHCGQLIYPKPIRSDQSVIPLESNGRGTGFNSILDFVAAIHLCVFPVKEAERMESARQHFLMMIATSRESWKLILAETDDDREWLPNPQQTGVLPMPVNQALIDGWLNVLNEIESLLEGQKLVPFWRVYSPSLFGQLPDTPGEGVGVNLKRIFEEPEEFDLVLTIQGTAVLPFVEKGQLSTPETWRELRRVFGGNFFGFAVWFN